MKKAVVVFAFLLLSALTVLLVFTKRSNNKSEEAMEQAILCLLADEVFEAVHNYYGEPRQYWNAKLISVQKLSEYPNRYEVVLQIETFYGPHNPPYGIETITFHIQYGEVKLIHLEEKYADLRQSVQEAVSSEADVQNWMDLIKEYVSIDRLDRMAEFHLINQVAIHEQTDERGHRRQSVQVKYNFVGCVS